MVHTTRTRIHYLGFFRTPKGVTRALRVNTKILWTSSSINLVYPFFSVDGEELHKQAADRKIIELLVKKEDVEKKTFLDKTKSSNEEVAEVNEINEENDEKQKRQSTIDDKLFSFIIKNAKRETRDEQKTVGDGASSKITKENRIEAPVKKVLVNPMFSLNRWIQLI